EDERGERAGRRGRPEGDARSEREGGEGRRDGLEREAPGGPLRDVADVIEELSGAEEARCPVGRHEDQEEEGDEGGERERRGERVGEERERRRRSERLGSVVERDDGGDERVALREALERSLEGGAPARRGSSEAHGVRRAAERRARERLLAALAVEPGRAARAHGPGRAEGVVAVGAAPRDRARVDPDERLHGHRTYSKSRGLPNQTTRRPLTRRRGAR